MLRGVCGEKCAWVLQRGVCVWGEGRVCCASVNSKAGNCRTCVIAFQPTIKRVVCLLLFVVVSWCYCYCQLYSYIVKHTHAHTAVYCLLFFWWASPFNWQTLQPAARLRLKLKTFWTPPTPTHTVWGMWQLWHNWQLTAVATFAQARSDSACHIREGKSKTSNSRDFTIYLYVFWGMQQNQNLLIANVSDAKRNYSHPHGRVATRFQVEPSSVECASASVCSFIQKDSFAFAIRLREASSRLAPLLSPLSCCCLRQFMRITFSHFREWLNIVYSAATPSYRPCGRDVGACNWLGPWRKILFNHLASEKFSS